jgi:hypothetical protein
MLMLSGSLWPKMGYLSLKDDTNCQQTDTHSVRLKQGTHKALRKNRCSPKDAMDILKLAIKEELNCLLPFLCEPLPLAKQLQTREKCLSIKAF